MTANGSDKRPGGRGLGGLEISPKQVLAGVLGLLGLWFVAVNHHSATIRFWLTDVRAPVWLVRLGTFLLGMLTGFLLRRRR